jgi:phospholipase A1
MLLALLIHTFSTFAATDTNKTDTKTAKELENKPISTNEFKKEEESMLKRHQPFYFAYGRPSSKIQVSFKVPIIKDQPFYLAYTQQMFWNLSENSKPFQDSTYNPELIYRWSLKDNWISSIDIAPISHISNGKKDLDSRSYNKRYVKFNFDRELSNWIFRGGLQLAYLYAYEDTNVNIRDYVGPLTLSFSAVQLFDGWVDAGEFGVQITPGGKYAEHWSRGGYQFSYSFRLGGLEVMPAFYIQYYVGYAETLLNYDQRVNQVRFGFIL